MTRLKDVARLAGVSTATTSRVLSGKDYVSDELRRRVLAAVRELNYTPDGIARSMSQGKTLTLGLVVSDVTNPFFTAVARGVEDVAQESGYSVVLCNTDENVEKEKRYLSVLREKRVDGLLLAVAGREVAHIQRLIDAGTKIVLIDRTIPELAMPSVEVDNAGGVAAATRYLLALGHRRIGMITGNLEITTGSERLRGFQEALAAAQVPLDPALLVPGGFHEDGGYEAGLRLMACTPRPTAVISWGNAATTGLLMALRQRRLRVPEDISVIGFDDLPYFALLDHPITVIAQPNYELGRRACQLLLDYIGPGQLAVEERRILLPTQLVIRESCRGVGAP